MTSGMIFKKIIYFQKNYNGGRLINWSYYSSVALR